MDKNTWIGFLLIACIIVGFSLFNRPSKEEMARRQHEQDSIAMVQRTEQAAEAASRAISEELAANEPSGKALSAEEIAEKERSIYGAFAPAAHGDSLPVVVETDLLRLTFSPKGGRIEQAELKAYKTYGDSLNYLSLFQGDEANMSFTLLTSSNRILTTDNLYFTALPIEKNDSLQLLTMRLLTDSADSYIDFVYSIPQNDYMLSLKIDAHNMQSILAQNKQDIDMRWEQLIPMHERGRSFEERYSTLQYMYRGGDIENLSEQKSEQKHLESRLKWIAFKDQFFSSVIIADDAFASPEVESTPMPKGSNYIKSYSARTALSFDPSGKISTGMRMYFGPNHYNTLKAYDKGVNAEDKLHLKSLVPLGWKIVSWINMVLVIPMFELFSSWGMHIGIIILLMTLVIKLIILPFTFKSYQSTAKMRVLKPQIDAINEKYPAEKMQERQAATMALYQRVGVSPMSGCLPMLFQFPVVMAMFWFFPTAIDLRGQSFLWADDLSAYDAILSWNTSLPLIGTHISLFCLLMTAVNIVYTYINMQTQSTGGEQMKFMKWMMYAMPLIFFFVLNDYPAGLSYYYLLSLFFTILQTMIFRWTTDDEKLLKKLNEKAAKNDKKPKKSGLMARLEKMQREQQAYARQQADERAKKMR